MHVCIIIESKNLCFRTHLPQIHYICIDSIPFFHLCLTHVYVYVGFTTPYWLIVCTTKCDVTIRIC